MILRGRESRALLIGSRRAKDDKPTSEAADETSSGATTPVGSNKRKPPKDARMTFGALDQLSRRVWRRHIIWNELTGTGFPGIYTTAGWHAWRHIVATAMLNATGSFVMAADSIQDSVDMARAAYTRFTSRDREAEFRSSRRQCLERVALAA